jgi:hypothetical protein
MGVCGFGLNPKPQITRDEMQINRQLIVPILDFGFWIAQPVWWRASRTTRPFSRFCSREARAETAVLSM